MKIPSESLAVRRSPWGQATDRLSAPAFHRMKVLVAGDVAGHFDVLFERVAAVHTSAAQAPQMIICKFQISICIYVNSVNS